MVSTERVLQLVRLGYIPRTARNQYALVGVVQGYIRFLKDEEKRNSKSASQNRVSDARAREIELRTAERANQLIDYEEHAAIVDELCGMFVSETAGLPARVTREVTMRRKIEKELNDIRARIVARAQQASEDVRAGGTAAPSVAEDDA